MKKAKKAFTLVEVMIVISILGLLASIIIPTVFESKKKVDRVEISPVEIQGNFKVSKAFSVNGYDIYRFSESCVDGVHYVAIPSKPIVLEK